MEYIFHVVFLLFNLIDINAWREQMADTIDRQNIQAARIMIERVSIQIMLAIDLWNSLWFGIFFDLYQASHLVSSTALCLVKRLVGDM